METFANILFFGGPVIVFGYFISTFFRFETSPTFQNQAIKNYAVSVFFMATIINIVSLTNVFYYGMGGLFLVLYAGVFYLALAVGFIKQATSAYRSEKKMAEEHPDTKQPKVRPVGQTIIFTLLGGFVFINISGMFARVIATLFR
jgi:hypothetical protein